MYKIDGAMRMLHDPARKFFIKLSRKKKYDPVAFLLASGILDGALHRVDILFPTPPLKSRHMLFSEDVVADIRRGLAPGGVVHIATDVPALGRLVRALFMAWSEAPPPPPSPELSRRDRVCRRDDIPVARMTFTP